MRYHGRFAPSPTGSLHFGSLVAALASFLDARARDGTWSIRIEDIDPPREQPGASTDIIATLSTHGMESDIPIVYQSDHYALYERYLRKLLERRDVFPCPCSRAYLAENNGQHSKQCRDQKISAGTPVAYKFKQNTKHYSWHDGVQGYCEGKLNESFVLKRKDDLYAYQLAVVSDDIQSNITHVVRGSDLLESTPMQLAIYQSLEIAPPTFAHIPVLVNKSGQKLSKQNLADPIDENSPLDNLKNAAAYLHLKIEPNFNNIPSFLTAAIRAWDINKIPKMREIEFSGLST